MTWIATNWFWILIGVAFVAMHLFGHGGHSGHADHRDADAKGSIEAPRGTERPQGDRLPRSGFNDPTRGRHH